MGISSDFLEQAAETYGEYIDEKRGHLASPGYRTITEESPIIFECPLCGKSFGSYEHERKHLIERHANQQTYLRVNGQIFNDFCFAEGEIRELEIVSLSQEPVSLGFRINNGVEKQIQFNDSISLLDSISRVSEGEISIRTTILSSHKVKNFIIYYNKQPTFESLHIDQAAVRYLFLPLSKNADPDFATFQLNLQNAQNPLEKRYAESLYNYSLAFFLNSKKINAKEFFENSLFGLLVFSTNFAITATRVLSLRMNVFGFLKSCGPRSMFYLANCFFNNQEPQYTQGHIAGNEANTLENEYGIYIDKETEVFLDILSAYYSRDFNMLDELIRALEELYESNRNQLDKLCLLRARTAELLGKGEEAEAMYKYLLVNPIFEQEANRSLECLMRKR